MRKIKNKYESNALIEKLNLNHVASKVFDKPLGSIDPILNFMYRNEFPRYGVRTLGHGGGRFYYNLLPTEALLVVKNNIPCMLCESLKKADEENLIMNGEILVSPMFTITAVLNTRKGISCREAMREGFKTYVWDDKTEQEPSVPGLKYVIDYISQHEELIGNVVEFVLYDSPVGINKENIIIWEVRDY